MYESSQAVCVWGGGGGGKGCVFNAVKLAYECFVVC